MAKSRPKTRNAPAVELDTVDLPAPLSVQNCKASIKLHRKIQY